MKKYINICILLFVMTICNIARAQNVERVFAVQAGTVKLQKGKAVVELNDMAKSRLSIAMNKPAYFISLTPIGNCSGLSIKEKTADKFSVQEINGNAGNSSFDYIVYLREDVSNELLNTNVINARPVEVPK